MIGRLLVLIAVVCSAGCNSDGNKRWPTGGLAWPFAPVSIRVHPLTHLDRDDDGQLLLICHIALLDTWNESVRGVGELHVSFFGPGSSRPEQNAQWTFDLYERAVNDLLYDPATQTYRLKLGNLPPWVAELATATDQAGRGTIMAELTTIGAEMERHTIRAEATLRP